MIESRQSYCKESRVQFFGLPCTPSARFYHGNNHRILDYIQITDMKLTQNHIIIINILIIINKRVKVRTFIYREKPAEQQRFTM